MSIGEAALKFFESCDTSQGWDKCKANCYDNASFPCKVAPMSGVSTVANYAV